MSHNVHGHKQPEPFKTNPDNPIFQRHQPEYEQPEVPAGLHGAPALRSELQSPVEEVKPNEPSAADLDAVAAEQAAAAVTIGETTEEEPTEQQDTGRKSRRTAKDGE